MPTVVVAVVVVLVVVVVEVVGVGVAVVVVLVAVVVVVGVVVGGQRGVGATVPFLPANPAFLGMAVLGIVLGVAVRAVVGAPR